ncbi:MAG TPA: hypothetical protein VKE40_22530 [Gemmataceae bacterium]|nr:hypothetical protein [Gemmataceae bacterium]
MRLLTLRTGRGRLLARLGALVPLLVALGCSAGTGKVSGQVTYKGKPVPAGRVLFRPADSRQNSVPAELDAEGKYSVVLPAGEVSVSIDNREWEPQPTFGTVVPPIVPPDLAKKLGGKAKAPEEPVDVDPTKTADAPQPRRSGKYVPIPEKYYELETSGLKFTVTRGDQTKNFELTD